MSISWAGVQWYTTLVAVSHFADQSGACGYSLQVEMDQSETDELAKINRIGQICWNY
jgi:hypothetical protein